VYAGSPACARAWLISARTLLAAAESEPPGDGDEDGDGDGDVAAGDVGEPAGGVADGLAGDVAGEDDSGAGCLDAAGAARGRGAGRADPEPCGVLAAGLRSAASVLSEPGPAVLASRTRPATMARTARQAASASQARHDTARV
jgi:hypothetical protein